MGATNYLFFLNGYDQVTWQRMFDMLLFDKFVEMLPVADFIAFAANLLVI